MNSKIRYGSILIYQDTNLCSLCKVYRQNINKEESKDLESWILQRFYHLLKFFIEQFLEFNMCIKYVLTLSLSLQLNFFFLSDQSLSHTHVWLVACFLFLSHTDFNQIISVKLDLDISTGSSLYLSVYTRKTMTALFSESISSQQLTRERQESVSCSLVHGWWVMGSIMYYFQTHLQVTTAVATQGSEDSHSQLFSLSPALTFFLLFLL